MKENLNITRRGFLRVVGAGAAAAAVTACGGKKAGQGCRVIIAGVDGFGRYGSR